MSRTLNIDGDYEHVVCPVCSKKFWTLVQLAKKQITCPGCSAPLIAPTIDMDAIAQKGANHD